MEHLAVLKKLNIGLSYDLAIPILGLYPKELKAETEIDVANVHCTIIHNGQKVKHQLSRIGKFTDTQRLEVTRGLRRGTGSFLLIG